MSLCYHGGSGSGGACGVATILVPYVAQDCLQEVAMCSTGQHDTRGLCFDEVRLDFCCFKSKYVVIVFWPLYGPGLRARQIPNPVTAA